MSLYKTLHLLFKLYVKTKYSKDDTFGVSLPFKGLNGVAYEWSVKKHVKLFRCHEPGSLPGSPGWKNHGDAEMDA